MALSYPELAEQFSRLVAAHRGVTILSHTNPDPDAIGTSLGIYLWLKEQGIRVEIANADPDLPRNLDFLSGFSKIKSKIDFEDSLIIACDSGSLDRLGFDLSGRRIVNLDHHHTNTQYGTLNIVDPDAVSSSEIAYRLLSPLRPFSGPSATALYAALVSDTRNFTTGNIFGPAHQHQIFNTNAVFALFVIAGLVGNDHAGKKFLHAAARNRLGAFMNGQIGPDQNRPPVSEITHQSATR